MPSGSSKVAISVPTVCKRDNTESLQSTNMSFEIKLRGPAVCVFMDIQTSDLKEYTKNDTGLLKLLSSLGTEICIKLDLY